MYTIYWTNPDGYYAKMEFSSWWAMIGHVAKETGLAGIACSDNDVFNIYNFNYGTLKNTKKSYRRHVFVYDEYDRIIPYSEIRDACGEYKEPPRRKDRIWHYRGGIFKYRSEPVPGIGVYPGSRYSRPNCYKNTWAKAMYEEDNPRARKHFEIISDWDGKYRKPDKNWKEYRKTQYKGLDIFGHYAV